MPKLRYIANSSEAGEQTWFFFKVGIMQRENNSLSLRLSLAMNNATDVSGVYNGISGMISSDCQCLRPTELLAGCTYARVFTVLLFRVESLHISYDRGIGESYHENNKKYKTKTKTNRFIKGEELCC